MKLPDLEELIGLRGAAQGLTLHAHRPALARLQGGHRSAQRGRGLEFEEVRLYAPGDDARSIDWRVTARRGKPHTKLFREERERPVWLLVDLHPGLFFGSKLQYKSALMVRAAALLGWVAALGGDRLGAVIASGDVQPQLFAPKARTLGVLPVLSALVEAQPTRPDVPSSQGLGRAMAALRPLLQPGSLVLVLSDFLGLNADAESALVSATVHNELRLLWMTDPLERAGLPRGNFRVGLPGRIWNIDGAHSRSQWQSKWNAQAQGLEALANRHRLPLVRLETSESVVQTLPALLKEPVWAM